MSVKLVGKIPDLANVPASARKKAMRTVVVMLRKKARGMAPVRTGKLRKGIGYSVQAQGWRGLVKAKGRTAHLVHEGTESHIIRGPCLLGGQWRTNIWHPGSKPNRFMKRAYDSSQIEIERILKAAGDDALDEAVRNAKVLGHF